MSRASIIFVLLLASWVGTSFAQNDPVRIIFMHHSTGQGIMEQGGVREALTELGYEFWDHGYNDEGLRGPTGEYLGVNWDVPGDNTDPDGWQAIFNQPVTSPPTNTFSQMLEYDVIVFKSCFPSSDIQNDEQLEAYRAYYQSIRQVIEQHPDKLFIPWTTPPLGPNATTPENAARAARWADYLTSEEYIGTLTNIYVFDVFHLLADENGFLRTEYRVDEWDSHPNEVGNQFVGPILADFIDQAIRSFTPGTAVQPTPSTVASDLVTDFEQGKQAFADHLWSWQDDNAIEFTCSLDTLSFGGQYAMRISYTLVEDSYAVCGMLYDEVQDWSHAEGISLYWRSDHPGQTAYLQLYVENPQNPENPTLFETTLATPENRWTPLVVRWDAFLKPDWFEGGVEAFDPSQIHQWGMTFGNWEAPQQAVVWIDEVRLIDE